MTKKVSVIGAGNVGTSCVDYLGSFNLCDTIGLVDIKPGLAEGKALDLHQKFCLLNSDTQVVGSTSNYAVIEDSEVVVITSGTSRLGGTKGSQVLDRDAMLGINATIITDVVQNIVSYAPNAVIILVTNPLDVICYHAWKKSGFPPKRIVGMAGILDSARFKTFLAQQLHAQPNDIDATVIGKHGDEMLPLVTYSYYKGEPVANHIDAATLQDIVSRTQQGGAEITSLMKFSGYFCPGTAAGLMVKAIIHDEQKVYPCSTYLHGQYGVDDMFIGVPIKLGSGGVQEIIELDLSVQDQKAFQMSVESISQGIKTLDTLSL